MITILSAPIAQAKQPLNLEALMSKLASVESVRAEYTEALERSLLSVTPSTNGHLTYRAPDHIEMRSDTGERIEIDGSGLRLLRDGNLTREFAVSQHRPLERLIVALTAVFAGDLERLRRDYTLKFEAGEERWSLALHPTDTGSGPFSVVADIRIAGADARIDEIELTESDGDRRLLRMRIIDQVITGRR